VDLDFDAIEKVSDFVSVPEGSYLCEIAEVRNGVTRNDDERWSLRLVVAEGEYCGRHAAWDSLVFSTRGQVRVRLVLEALGLPTKGRVQLKSEDLMGLRAFVEVRPEEYQHPDTGNVVRRNAVPYRGYRTVQSGKPEENQVDSEGTGDEPAGQEIDEEELPF